MNFDADYFWNLLLSTRFLHPAWIVVWMVAVSMTIGIALGAIGGIIMTSAIGPLKHVIRGYVALIRGIPVLVQIIFWYNGVPALTGGAINPPPFVAGIIALAINEGAYMTEIVRSGITAVERGQREASQALSLSYYSTMRRVILPQAIRIAIPPTGNQVINMIKNTSLLFAIAIPEIFATGTNIFSVNFRYFEVIAVVAIWYIILANGYGLIQKAIERRFARGRGSLFGT
ncbi:amino acid ABC transporter permease [Tropicimonas sp. IMCC34011]|uniref:amino acid ABC transporter permease n=1 Tax=Tropicimonas sp. IMCC34011 TaxID=2248759 RepID=UPI000E224284|nr:amino acid ABC transporter permease [Tropicimonas sp. IMCC34011]